MQADISLIMPAFNRAYIITSAIDSIVKQTHPNWELIIMDDGSTDNTEQVVRAYNDPRIAYFKQPNAGPSAARNNAIAHATAPWLAYLDSDNELLPDFIASMLRAFQVNPDAKYGIPKGKFTYELYAGETLLELVDHSHRFPDRLSIADVFNRKINFDMNGFMHRRDLFGGDIGFDPLLKGIEDWDLVLQMGNKYPDAFLYVPEFLVAYRRRYGTDGIMSGSSYIHRANELERIYRKHKGAPLMQTQTWYPKEVNEWIAREEQFQRDQLPPAWLFPFPNHWPEHLREVLAERV